MHFRLLILLSEDRESLLLKNSKNILALLSECFPPDSLQLAVYSLRVGSGLEAEQVSEDYDYLSVEL